MGDRNKCVLLMYCKQQNNHLIKYPGMCTMIRTLHMLVLPSNIPTIRCSFSHSEGNGIEGGAGLA